MVAFLAMNGSIRTKFGTANANRIKKDGMLPAVIYGKENLHISVSKREFDKEYLKGAIRTKPIELKVDDKVYRVLVYQIDLDPVTDMPRHVDFSNIEGKSQVKVYIPISFVGREKSPGLKKGGFLNILKRSLQCYCDPLNIPSEIVIDVSRCHIGTKIQIRDVKLPSNIKPVEKELTNICSVTGRGKSDMGEKSATVSDASSSAATTATPAAASQSKPEAKK